jgi:hypothetical protein
MLGEGNGNVMHWHRITKINGFFETAKMYKMWWVEPSIKCSCCKAVECTDLMCLVNEMGR